MSANPNITLTITRDQAAMILEFLNHEIAIGKQIATKVFHMDKLANVLRGKLHPIETIPDIEPQN